MGVSDDERILALFNDLDQLPGPDHLEFPDTFDHAAAKARAIRLRDRLSGDFGHPCRLDQIRDAAYCSWSSSRHRQPEPAFRSASA